MHDDCNYLIQYKNVLSKATDILGINQHFGLPTDQESSTKRGSGASVKRFTVSAGGDVISQPSPRQSSQRGVEPLIEDLHDVSLGYLAGTILKEEQLRMKRLVFRTTRGKALVKFDELMISIEDYKGNKTEKSVYVIIF